MSPDTHNIPPELAIRAKPRGAQRFSRKALTGGALLISGVMCAALAFTLQTPEHEVTKGEELYNVTHKPMAAGLETLPKSYAELKPTLGPPLPGDLGAAYLDRVREAELGQPAVIPASASGASATPRPVRTVAYPTYAATPAPNYSAVAAEPDPAEIATQSSLFFELAGSAAVSAQPAYTETNYPSLPAYPVNFEGFSQSPLGYGLQSQQPDPNGQGSKQAFLDREADDIYNSGQLQSPRSPYQVMAGGLIPASLVTGLNSDLPGQIIGQVTQNVYDTVTGEYLLIPQGSRLIGRYDSVIAFGQSRALVVWTRLILPNGKSIQLDNLPGTDGQGFAGLKDKVDSHTWNFLKGAVLSSLLSVGSELASDEEDRVIRALQNAGQDTANIAGQRIIERNLNVQPTLKVRPGWRFNVVVSRDLILEPYGE